MKEKGLVAIIDSTQYTRMQSDVSRLDSVNRDIQSYRTQVSDYQTQRDEFSSKLDSAWHKFWSKKSTLDTEYRELADVNTNLQNVNQKLSDSKAEEQRIEKVKQDLEGYVRTSEGYVKLSDVGSKRFAELGIRLYRISDQDYDIAEKELEKTDQSIQESATKFRSHYDEASSKGLYTGEKLRMAMATLSKKRGETSDNISAFRQAYDLLSEKSHNWNSSDSYGVIASLVNEGKSIEERVGLIDSVYMSLVEAGISSGSSTRNLSGRLINGEDQTSASQKIARFHEIYNQFKETYGGSDINRMASSSLVNIKGSAQEVVASFTGLYDKVKETFGSGDRLKLATATLMFGKQAGMNVDNRFQEAYKKLKDRGRSGSDYYPLLAGISLMPGSLDEVFEILEKTQKIVKGGNIGDRESLFIASNLMSNVYQTWNDLGVFEQANLLASTIDSSNYSSSSNLDFSVGVSLFATDFISGGDILSNFDFSSNISGGSFDFGGGSFGGGGAGGSW
jgi:uncharacterized protein YoxC